MSRPSVAARPPASSPRTATLTSRVAPGAAAAPILAKLKLDFDSDVPVEEQKEAGRRLLKEHCEGFLAAARAGRKERVDRDREAIEKREEEEARLRLQREEEERQRQQEEEEARREQEEAAARQKHEEEEVRASS